jgi:ubiquinone/menaquinone biosynthesis C-methylase UbiE
MNLQEATTLINNQSIASLQYPTTWADLGCGEGLFTRALANLLNPASTIFAIDKTPVLNSSMLSNGTMIKSVAADFERDDLPFAQADGILMANSLHYVQRKEQFIRKLLPQCKNNVIIIIVEYETRLANTWVPYPISFSRLGQLLTTTGFRAITQIGKHHSVYSSGFIYSALATK